MTPCVLVRRLASCPRKRTKTLRLTAALDRRIPHWIAVNLFLPWVWGWVAWHWPAVNRKIARRQTRRWRHRRSPRRKRQASRPTNGKWSLPGPRTIRAWAQGRTALPSGWKKCPPDGSRSRSMARKNWYRPLRYSMRCARAVRKWAMAPPITGKANTRPRRSLPLCPSA